MTLDNVQKIVKADKKETLKATSLLDRQCQQAWEEAIECKLPASYKNIDYVVVGAMGDHT